MSINSQINIDTLFQFNYLMTTGRGDKFSLDRINLYALFVDNCEIENDKEQYDQVDFGYVAKVLDDAMNYTYENISYRDFKQPQIKSYKYADEATTNYQVLKQETLKYINEKYFTFNTENFYLDQENLTLTDRVILSFFTPTFANMQGYIFKAINYKIDQENVKIALSQHKFYVYLSLQISYLHRYLYFEELMSFISEHEDNILLLFKNYTVLHSEVSSGYLTDNLFLNIFKCLNDLTLFYPKLEKNKLYLKLAPFIEDHSTDNRNKSQIYIPKNDLYSSSILVNALKYKLIEKQDYEVLILRQQKSKNFKKFIRYKGYLDLLNIPVRKNDSMDESVSEIDKEVENQFNDWEQTRKNLLNFSNRNPLISYKTKKSSIEIFNEKSVEIYNILVTNTTSMTFDSLELEEEDEETQTEYSFSQPNDNRKLEPNFTDNKLQTKHSNIELQGRLRTISRRAKSDINEKGVNTLYLALGFLKWYEKETSDIEHYAPLILIPTTLDRTSLRSKFRLQFNDEEPGVNISLLEKLKLEHGIDIKAEEIDSQENIKSFYSLFSNAVKEFDRWEVLEDEIRLGFFSFGKFLMYNDLDPKNWDEDNQPLNHDIISKLLGGGFDSGLQGADNNSYENVQSRDIYHVLESDSSQEEVILSIRDGQNMVVQGPPGTGKSQTISNIISDFIARGKKVLFVAEKMAALNVVKNRLDSLGIGDIALELHSSKTKKKEFLESLKTTLDLAKPDSRRLNEDFLTDLEITKEKLDEYSELMNTQIRDSGFTPIQVFGHKLNSQDAIGKVNIPKFEIDDLVIGDKEDYKGKLKIVQEVKLALDTTGSMSTSPFKGIRTLKFNFYSSERWIDDIVELNEKYKALNKDISEIIAEWSAFDVEKSPKRLASLKLAIEALRRKPEESNINYANPQLNSTRQIQNLIDTVTELTEFNALYDTWKNRCFDLIWNKNVLDVRGVLIQKKDNFFRKIIPSYRRAMSTIRSWTKDGNIKEFEAYELVDLVLRYQESHNKWEESKQSLVNIFGDCKSIYDIPEYWLKSLIWVKEVKNLLDNDDFFNPLIKLERNVEYDFEFLNQSIEKYDQYNDKLNQLLIKVEHDDTFSISENIRLDIILEKLKNWSKHKNTLQPYIQLLKNIGKFKDKNLGWLIGYVENWDLAKDHIVDLFNHIWFTKLSLDAISDSDTLNTFVGDNHHETVKKFIELENKALIFNRYRVIDQHYSNLPENNGLGVGNLGILNQEFSKKTRHLPIRLLLSRCSQPIQAIKPLFMMSPMSIAQYLPQKNLEFDLVLFDEASQIEPVDAFGAILRGKQVVVVGDNKQLPPTKFFQNDIDSDDENIVEDNLKTKDVESILTLFLAKQAKEKMLRWHYRSKHESLITVNNIEFYNGRLNIFPTPLPDDPKRGLQFKLCKETIYEAGKNINEAKEIVQAIIEHAQNHPNLSLGVATFSVKQRQIIEDVLEKELLDNNLPDVEHFINENNNAKEPFFIKNLENVQGDERDVIYISVGYGRQANKKLSMNFGPINKDGGERRLNVLFSRAKQQCVIFSNFKGSEIDLTKTNSVGVRAFKKFLQFADTGQLDVPEVGEGFAESPFEEQVANAIVKHGYEVVPQVGSNNFRIDICVKHPEEKGRFILAVECDGASYHSSKLARDRDKSRQQVLEGQGWKFHRIWSTDWFNSPEIEINKLISSIKYHIKDENKIKIDSKPYVDELIRVDDEVTQVTKLEDLLVPYEVYEPKTDDWSKWIIGYDLYKYSNTKKYVDWILNVVKVEQPVHEQVVLLRILELTDTKKAGKRIKTAHSDTVKTAIEMFDLYSDQDFLFLSDENIQLRDRSKLSPKFNKIEYLPPAEVKLLIKEILKTCYGAEKDEIEKTVIQYFGFTKRTNESASLVEECLNSLINGKKIKQNEGIYNLNN